VPQTRDRRKGRIRGFGFKQHRTQPWAVELKNAGVDKRAKTRHRHFTFPRSDIAQAPKCDSAARFVLLPVHPGEPLGFACAEGLVIESTTLDHMRKLIRSAIL